MSNCWNKIFAVTLLLLGIHFGLSAQVTEPDPKDNSPYSRLGLGDLLNQNFAANAGMGGLSASFHDPYHLNLINPASNAWLQATAFEVGFFTEYNRLSNNNSSANIWNGNLKYIALGFPLKNPINEVLNREQSKVGWGMNFALTPFSNVEYNIETEAPLIGRDTTDIISTFKGRGGLYKVNWGNAIRYKAFSAGVNLGYIFGKITNSREVYLNDNLYYFDNFLDEFSINGFVWNAGVQYDLIFRETDSSGKAVQTGKRITFGAYGNSTSSFSTTSTTFNTREFVDQNTNLRLIDTLTNTQDVSGSGKLPAEFGVGILYQRVNKLRLGVDYSLASWNNYENEAKPEALKNTWRASVGVEYTPDYASYNSYLKRVRYRAGLYYRTDPRSYNGEQVNEYGLSLGCGFPVIMPRQQTSFVNLAVEAGQLGVSDGLQETFARLTLGFTLNDNTWFFKRKFN